MITVQRTRRYCSQLKWLVQQIGVHGRLLAMGSLVFQLIGISAMAGFLIFLYGYLGFQDGENTGAGVLQWIYEQSLWMVITLNFGLGIIGAFCLYYGEWLAIRLSRRLHPMYSAMASQAMLVQGVFQEVKSQYSTANKSRIVSISPRYAAISTRRIISAFAPVLSVIGGLVSLFLISWQSTIILFVVGVVFAICLSRLNLKAARLQHAYHNTSGSTSRKARELMAMAHDEGEVPLTDRLHEEILDSDDSQKELDALYGRMLVLRTSNFLNMSFMVTAICLIVATTMMVFNEQDWALLLAYLVMLRITATGMKQISGLMVTVSRYFPEVEKLHIAMSACSDSGDQTLSDSALIQSEDSSIEDDEADE